MVCLVLACWHGEVAGVKGFNAEAEELVPLVAWTACVKVQEGGGGFSAIGLVEVGFWYEGGSWFFLSSLFDGWVLLALRRKKSNILVAYAYRKLVQ